MALAVMANALPRHQNGKNRLGNPRRHRSDRWWNAFLVPHGDHVVISNEQGDLIFAKLTREGYKELSRAK